MPRPFPDAAMLPAAREQRELERAASAPGHARRCVDRHRDALGEDAWRRTRLLVTELVTNALRHGSGVIVLELTPMPKGLHVCVRDEGGGRPEARRPDGEGGYGLHLVADLSDRWGRGDERNGMWFEIDRREHR